MNRSYRPRPALLAGILVLVTSLAAAQSAPDILWQTVGHDGPVRDVAFAADSASLLSGGGASVRLWDAETGAATAEVGPHPANLLSAALSPDGSMVAAGWVEGTWPPGGVMRLWDAVDETAIRDHGGAFVRFSPDGGVIASAGGGVNRDVNLHDTASGADLGDLYNGPGYIKSLAFSPDGSLLAVGCTDNTIKLWDVASQTLLDELGGFQDDVAAVAFSRDGELLAGAEGGFDVAVPAWIRVFQTEDGSGLGAWEAHGDAAHALAFGPDGEIIASSGRDGTAPLSQSIRFWSVADGALLKEYDEQALSLAVDGDGARLAWGRGDGSVVVAAEDVLADLTAAPVPAAGAAVLHPARPNPFNPMTEVRFELAARQEVRLAVFDAAGRRVAVLADGHREAGAHRVRWNGLDARGRTMPSGAYLLRLETGETVVSRKISLVR